MNKVLVIGPTYKSEIITTKQRLNQSQYFDCDCESYLFGGSYTLAYNLASLDVNTYFITRMASDDEGNRLFNNIDRQNVIVSLNNHVLDKTPSKIKLFSDNDMKVFDDIPYNCYPSLEDSIPSEFLLNTDYILLTVYNNNYVNTLMNKSSNSKFVCCNCVISDDLLNKVEGIIFEEEYLNSIVDVRKMDNFIQDLIDKGVNYVIVVDKGKGVYLYTRKGNNYFGNNECGNYPLGSYEAFCSMFIASLANQELFSVAINRAVKLENDFSYCKAMAIEKDMFE